MESIVTEVVDQEFVIQNRLGLHARAAAQFVKVANRHGAALTVKKEHISVNGKSIMGVLMLAAPRGTVIRLIASGADAATLVEELGMLINNKFGEEP